MSRQLSPGEVEQQPVKREEEYYQNLNIAMMCPECKNWPPNLVEEFSAGDMVCGDCGLVLASHLVDTRSEWRTFSNDDQGNDDPSRVGDAANPLLDGSQLTTSIAFGEGGAMARDISRAHKKITDTKSNRNLTEAYKKISNLCDSNGMSHIVSDTAKHLYKMTEESRQFRGKNQDAVIAGCIFLSGRQNGYGRSFKEVAQLVNVPKKDLGRVFKLLERYFSDYTKENATTIVGGAAVAQKQYTSTSSTKADELIPSFCSTLHLPDYVALIAVDCCKELNEKTNVAGRSPLSIAAVAIYMIAHLMGFPKSPKDVGQACRVSDGTIRTAYKAMEHQREGLIKKEWLDRGGKIDLLPTSHAALPKKIISTTQQLPLPAYRLYNNNTTHRHQAAVEPAPAQRAVV